jgi:hypothetical protein
MIILEVEKVTLRPELFADLLFCFFPRLGLAPSSCFDVLWNGSAARQSAQPLVDDAIPVSSSELCKAIGGEVPLSPYEAREIAHKLKFALAARCVFLDQKLM